MIVKSGVRVAGHINNAAGRVEFTGRVTDVYSSNGQTLVNVTCTDGVERTARAENVKAMPSLKLTPNMARTLGNLVRHGQVPADGLLAMNALGCTYPALQALERRGLAEIVGTGERRPRFDGGTYEVMVYRPTDAGQDAAK